MKGNIFTKTEFFSRMRFLLSFQYNESECSNIIHDYEEWFEGEKLNGKTDEEICSEIGSPKELVKKITFEAKSDASKFSILLHNQFLQFLCITCMRIWIELHAFYFSGANGLNYLTFALIINAVYFVCALAAVREKHALYLMKAKNIIVTAVFTAVLFSNFLIMTTAEDIQTGPYTVRIHTAMIYIIYAITIVQGGREIMKKTQEVYMQALHGLGLASVMLFIITQYHSLYQSREEAVRILICGSVGIYLEILCLVILFRICRGGGKGEL